MAERDSKVCTACGKEKALSEFHSEPRVKSGLTAKCQDCTREQNRVYRTNHPEKVAASRARYAAKYPERVLAAQRYSDRRAKLERMEKRIAEQKPFLEPRLTDDGRRCSSCRRRKPIDQFAPDASAASGLSCYCRDCINQKARERATQPGMREYRRRYSRASTLKQYGLTIEVFDEMFARQNGKCAICHEPLNLGTGGCGVDHDHDTGHVRGLLCRLCNIGLGHFRDDPRKLTRAILYLEGVSTTLKVWKRAHPEMRAT